MTRFETTNRTQLANKSSARRPGMGRKPSSRAARARGGQPNSYLSLGNALGSALDRQRLRERNAAERERVERMLASAPPPVEQSAPSRFSGARPLPGSTNLRSVPDAGCPVCESPKVVRDEVFHAGPMRLSECLHCDFQWTEQSTKRRTTPSRRSANLVAAMSRVRGSSDASA